MIDLYDFLCLIGLPKDRAVKMYRHVDKPNADIREIQKKGHIDLFQAVQSSHQLGNDVVIFFAGERGRTSRLLGVRRVISTHTFETATSASAKLAIAKKYMGIGAVWHELEPMPIFDPFVDRLIINWPQQGRHHQWLKRSSEKQGLSIPIHSIRPVGFEGQFPGFDELRLGGAQLFRIATEGDGGSGMIAALESVRGVYLISDTETGDLYVGSATGKDGFWGRWLSYAKSAHGGNKLMIEVMKNADDVNIGQIEKIEKRLGSLQFSILETLSNLSLEKDGLLAEKRWKNKLGKKAVILNGN